MEAKLPEFESPPLMEVALALQFEPLQELLASHIGLYWSTIKDRFPKVQEHPPRNSVFENFDRTRRSGTAPQIKLMKSQLLPLFWYLSENEDHLIQIQQDRFVHNWRKIENSTEYPRYSSVRNTFHTEIENFQEFLANENIGRIDATQCELTYLNHIYADSDQNIHECMEDVLTVFQCKFSDSFLSTPEDSRIEIRYLVPDDQHKPIARLHITAAPEFQVASDKPLISLRLIFRGHPPGSEIKDIMNFFDIGHDWIVRAFASITTEKMHEKWGRL